MNKIFYTYGDRICNFISDCEYVGHVIPVKKVISRDLKRKKASKRQGNGDNFINLVIYPFLILIFH